MMGKDLQKSIEAASFSDWITVAAYLACAVLALRAADKGNVAGLGRDKIFWQLSAAALVFLGINELFDFQTLLTAIGKAHAQAYGWYEQRRTVQLIFIVGLCLGGAISMVVSWIMTRGADFAVRLALIGFLTIGLFILVRAASFHKMDAWLGRGYREFNYGSIQEMAGIIVVAIGAWLYARRLQSDISGGAA